MIKILRTTVFVLYDETLIGRSENLWKFIQFGGNVHDKVVETSDATATGFNSPEMLFSQPFHQLLLGSILTLVHSWRWSWIQTRIESSKLQTESISSRILKLCAKFSPKTVKPRVVFEPDVVCSESWWSLVLIEALPMHCNGSEWSKKGKSQTQANPK